MESQIGFLNKILRKGVPMLMRSGSHFGANVAGRKLQRCQALETDASDQQTEATELLRKATVVRWKATTASVGMNYREEISMVICWR